MRAFFVLLGLGLAAITYNVDVYIYNKFKIIIIYGKVKKYRHDKPGQTRDLYLATLGPSTVVSCSIG